MKFIIPCVTSFLLTFAITPLVIRFANACNCLDVPGGRRLHMKITPRWGGLAFFAGVLPFLFMVNGSGTLTYYIVASFLLVAMGIMDDLKSLGWKTKFAGMVAAATIVIFGGDITVHQIGTYGSLGRLDLGWLSIPFTYVCIIGITNAINLLDGLNGLAGGVSLLGFLFMGIAAAVAGNIMVALVCFVFVGALGAFLLYNFPNARVFMGDSGSLFLGFSLSLTAVFLTQDANSSVDSMFPVLVLLIPIFDTLRVLLVRLMNGRNPFQADRLHLHFLIVEKNISPVNVALLFWSLTAVFGGIALTLTSKTSMPYLTVVLYASLLLGLFAVSLKQRQQTHEEIRLKMLRSADMEIDSAGLTRYDDSNPGFAHKGEMMTFKCMVVLGVLLLATQVFAGETPVLKTQMEDQTKTEEQRTLYAIGLLVSRSLSVFSLTPNELEIVKEGLTDSVTGKKPEVELAAYNDKVQELARIRRKAQGEKMAVVNKEFTDNAAKEKGAVKTDSGLIYLSLKEGDGASPKQTDTVKVNYRGTLPDGKEFDSSYKRGTPLEFKLDGVIKCWTEGLQRMKPGGKAKLVCPATIAYGETGAGELILPGATLAFEVELLEVKK